MGCCISRKEDTQPLIVDVQKIIADKVWTTFCDAQTRYASVFLRRSNFTVEVPMNFYDFQVVKQELVIRDARSGIPTTVLSEGSARQGNEQKKQAGPSREISGDRKDQTSPEHVGLKTDFCNDTGEDQTYNFTFEKTRKACVSVNYQKGFSFGNKTNFSVGVPQVLPGGQVGSEFSAQVTVTNTTGETFEETMTTTTTSNIKVAANSHYVASIVMEECNLHADFKVWVNMTMPAKEARAYLKDRHGETVFYYTLNNLSHLFPKENHLEIEAEDPNNPGTMKKKARSDAVQFEVKGVLTGIQMSSHKINLKSHKL